MAKNVTDFSCFPGLKAGGRAALVALTIVVIAPVLPGCGDAGGGTGSVDMTRAKDAAKTNPDIAKAAGARSSDLKGTNKSGRQ